jgi:hypothetical protein
VGRCPSDRRSLHAGGKRVPCGAGSPRIGRSGCAVGSRCSRAIRRSHVESAISDQVRPGAPRALDRGVAQGVKRRWVVGDGGLSPPLVVPDPIARIQGVAAGRPAARAVNPSSTNAMCLIRPARVIVDGGWLRRSCSAFKPPVFHREPSTGSIHSWAARSAAPPGPFGPAQTGHSDLTGCIARLPEDNRTGLADGGTYLSTVGDEASVPAAVGPSPGWASVKGPATSRCISSNACRRQTATASTSLRRPRGRLRRLRR